jgi:formiminotetrahydrofolate cyclodeaminase
MMLIKKTVRSFVSELASDSAAPGGGSASALAGCLGAALTTMVCNLSLDEEKYKASLPEILEIRAQASTLLEKLMLAIDADANAFKEVMNAYKLPKATDEEKSFRLETIQQSMKKASLLPLSVAADCLEALKLSHRILPIGNANAASDAAVAALMAYAAVQGALFNVKINLGFIKDAEFCAETRELIEEISVTAKKENAAMEAAVAKIFP